MRKFTRRHVLAASTVVAAGSFARIVQAAPEPQRITTALIEAAKKEGRVNYYTAMDLAVAEPLAKGFEAKFGGIRVAIERTGSEPLFDRIGREMAGNTRKVDVANGADAGHFVRWKRQGWLEPFVTPDIVENVASDERDPDGTWVNQRTHLSPIAYNSTLFRPENAPRSFNDLLDPRYTGKMVKANPAYSGTVLTATHQIVRELRWAYLEKLAGQRVLKVAAASDPLRKIEAGERAVAVDGSDHLFWMARARGAPIEVVYPVEGTPRISNPMAVFKTAPNPNAARLLLAWIISPEGQKFIVDLSGQYPANKLVKAKAGRPALASIKTFREDPAELERQADEIKARYSRLFEA